jgi:hypothetical protein
MIGLLFRPELVRALRDGRKTMTRRLVGLELLNAEPDNWQFIGVVSVEGRGAAAHFQRTEPQGGTVLYPRMPVGTVFYVKETWCVRAVFDHLSPEKLIGKHEPHFLTDGPKPPGYGRTRSPINLPEKLARMWFRVTAVTVQRVNEISEAAAKAEGVEAGHPMVTWPEEPSYIQTFSDLWKSINGPESWALNPWVWAYRFERVK